MTLSELKTLCNENKIPFAYGVFKTPQNPPHLAATEVASDNFIADNVVYKRIKNLKMDYTYEDKDIELEDTIENVILKDVAWNKSDEVYLQEEKCWQVSYFFDIREENKKWEKLNSV